MVISMNVLTTSFMLLLFNLKKLDYFIVASYAVRVFFQVFIPGNVVTYTGRMERMKF